MLQPPRRWPALFSPTAVGVLCGIGAALGWAAGFVAARHGVQIGLRPVDLAFHRFVWTGLLLMPLVWRNGIADLRGVGWGRAIVMALLAGPLQGCMSASGFTLTPLGHGAVIQPAAATLGGLCMATLVLREPLRPRSLVGAAAIVSGLVLLGLEAVKTIGSHGLLGDLLFVAAGSMWAAFTILLRIWRVRASDAAAAISAVSVLIYAPLHALMFGFEAMAAVGLWENLLQVLVQGVFAGALAVHLASRTVILLGAGRASAFPALVPPATLLIGFLALGDTPTLAQLAGLAVVAVGFRFALKP